MSERYRAGDRVRTSTVDPDHHTRLPAYARGKHGTVVETEGAHPKADDRARDLTVPPQPVYAVRFTAQELFGHGDHSVTLALWEDYLSNE